jgi:hypothetical protein
MPIGDVVTKYETRTKTMLGDIGKTTVWRDNAGRIGTYDRDEAINKANERFQPFSYSLDVGWQTHINQFKDIWTASADLGAARQRTEAMAMADRLAQENLSGVLKDWLIAADPFTERPDKDAIATRGEALLTRLGRCFEIAKGQGAEFLPDLVAMTQRVRARMHQIDGGMRSPQARSVPHQMYGELKDVITQSSEKTRDEVKKTAEQVKDDPAEAIKDWEQTLKERIVDFNRKGYADDPYSFWKDMVDDVFAGTAYSVSKVPACADDLRKLFLSRDFARQIKTLYDTINEPPSAKDYVLRVRDAAWAVQTTIDHYLRGIAANWQPSGDYERNPRDYLTCNLCVLSDRVLKEVNFIITSQLARQQ